jgi:hypothetical protein
LVVRSSAVALRPSGSSGATGAATPTTYWMLPETPAPTRAGLWAACPGTVLDPHLSVETD